MPILSQNEKTIPSSKLLGHPLRTMEGVEEQLSRSLEKIRRSPEIVKSIINFPHLNIIYSNTNWY